MEPLLSQAGVQIPGRPEARLSRRWPRWRATWYHYRSRTPRIPGSRRSTAGRSTTWPATSTKKSFQEMFGIGQLAGDVRHRTPLLDIFLPVDLYIIDLGGGLDARRVLAQ